MTKSDPAIVGFYGELDIAMPPAVVAYNLNGISYPTVTRRLPILVENNLLEKVDENKGYYEITDKGRAYLAGDLDADDLNSSDEAE